MPASTVPAGDVIRGYLIHRSEYTGDVDIVATHSYGADRTGCTGEAKPVVPVLIFSGVQCGEARLSGVIQRTMILLTSRLRLRLILLLIRLRIMDEARLTVRPYCHLPARRVQVAA